MTPLVKVTVTCDGAAHRTQEVLLLFCSRPSPLGAQPKAQPPGPKPTHDTSRQTCPCPCTPPTPLGHTTNTRDLFYLDLVSRSLAHPTTTGSVGSFPVFFRRFVEVPFGPALGPAFGASSPSCSVGAEGLVSSGESRAGFGGVLPARVSVGAEGLEPRLLLGEAGLEEGHHCVGGEEGRYQGAGCQARR